MKKNIKSFLQISFVVVIILAAAIAIFYKDISQFTGGQAENSYIQADEFWEEEASSPPSVNEATEGVSAFGNEAQANTSSSQSSQDEEVKKIETKEVVKSASPTKEPKTSKEKVGLYEALFYKVLSKSKVQCQLCFRKCVIEEGKRGFCRSRENIDGKLYTLTYGRTAAIHVDPVEKIPFSHYAPGTDALCIGTAACNLRCLNCINWQFAWKAPEDVETVSVSPEEIIRMAIDNGLKTVCFTYNEPTMCYEYMTDVFKLAHKKGLKTVLHTNGSMNPEPMKALLPYVDAVVADLKGFDEEFYKSNCSSSLSPVLTTLKTIKQQGVWLEVVNLVIPGRNDKTETVEAMCKWFKENLGEDTPLQFSRFFPTNKLTNLPPTPIKTLEEIYDIAARVGLQYPYIGNVPGSDQGNTYCPKCKELLIERRGIAIRTNNIKEGTCKFCGQQIAGIW